MARLSHGGGRAQRRHICIVHSVEKVCRWIRRGGIYAEVLSMYCPFCGEGALGAAVRVCPRCGAELAHPPAVTGGAVVGDGDERAMSALVWRAGLEWALSNRGRLALYAAGVALAVIVLAIVVITIVVALITAIAALAPVIFIIAILALASRRRRYRRWHRRWIRY